jgi:hypothetical protein
VPGLLFELDQMEPSAFIQVLPKSTQSVSAAETIPSTVTWLCDTHENEAEML